MKKKIFIIVIVIVAMFALVAKRKLKIKNAKPYGIRPVPVRVAEVKQGEVSLANDYLSVVEAWQIAQISSRISARVDNVFHDEGDVVKKGEILLQLDDKDIRENIKSVEKKVNGIKVTIDGLKTNLDYWAKENQRYKNLVSQGAISQANADDVYNKFVTAFSLFNSKSDELKALDHTKNSLATKLAYTKIASPFDGLVTHRFVDPGNLAVLGKVLMTVKDTSKLKLAFDAPQEDVKYLRKGLHVHLRDKKSYSSLKVTHLYPSLNSTRMLRVEIEIPTNIGYKVGTFVPIAVDLLQHENAIYVPAEALLENPNSGVVVFLVKNGKLKIKNVKKILESGGKVEVTGVNPGDKVVTSTFLGWSTLSSGLKVEVIK